MDNFAVVLSSCVTYYIFSSQCETWFAACWLPKLHRFSECSMNFSERNYSSECRWFDCKNGCYLRMKPFGFMMSAKKLKHLFYFEHHALMNRSLRPGTFVNVNKVRMFHVDFKCSMASFALISERACFGSECVKKGIPSSELAPLVPPCGFLFSVCLSV